MNAPPPGDTDAPLRDSEWVRRERLLDEFEREWRAGIRTPADEFLRRHPEGPPGLLVELVHTELELRIKAGEDVAVAEYLRRFPALAEDEPALRSLLDTADGLRRSARGTATYNNGEGPAGPAGDPAEGGARRLGQYELVEEIGRGTFGVVYRARDTRTGRVVAVKLARAGRSGRAGTDPELLREARNAAMLHHPGIVPLLDAGVIGGTFALVSDYVEGPTLAERMARGRFTPEDAARLVARVAEAVDAAHRQGVVHRDLKPANILIGPDGRPRVTDFGLARRATDATLTARGEVLGTPAYMAPEQAGGDGHSADARSDVYSLGVILYQLLTGSLPFRGQGVRLLDQVRAEQPAAPRALDSSVPVVLETVCLKCLEKDPRRRYAGAGELAADLRRYLGGERVRARPVSPLGRLERWARRRPGLAALAAGCLATGLGLVAALVWGAEQGRRAAVREASLRAGQAAARGAEVAAVRRRLYAVEVARAYAAWERSRFEAARQALEGLRPGPGEEDLRGFEWWHLWARCERDRVLRGHEGAVVAASFSPDGRRLATASLDRTIRVWDPRTWRPVGTPLGHDRGATGVAFLDDRNRLVTCGRDGTVRGWELPGAEGRVAYRAGQGAVQALARSPDGRTLAVLTTAPPYLERLDADTGRPLGPTEAADVVLLALAFTPDGRTILAGGDDGRVSTWDAETGRRRAAVLAQPEGFTALAVSPVGGFVATAGLDRSVAVWDRLDWRERFRLPGLPTVATSLAVSPGGDELAVGCRDEVRIVDLHTRALGPVRRGPTGAVRALAYAPDGSALVAAGDDGVARVWTAGGAAADTVSPAEPEVLPFAAGAEVPDCVRFSPEGGFLAVGGGGGVVELRPVNGGTPRRLDAGTRERIRDLVFLRDKRTLAVAPADGPVRLIDLAAGRPVRELGLPGDAVGVLWGVDVTPDGRTVVAAHGYLGRPGLAVAWDAATGQVRRELRGHGDFVRCVAALPDGVATAGADELVRIWDLGNGREVAALAGHRGQVFCAAASPTGRLLATGSEDLTVRLWDLEGRREAGSLRGHAGAVHALAFSPDGRRLASGSRDGAVLLWDVSTGLLLAELGSHPMRVNGLAFSPDGRTLASVGMDRNLRLWHGPTDGGSP